MVRGAWPIGGRDNLVRQLRDSLEPSEGYGVLLTGIAGVGKTALARGVLHDLRDSTRVVHIRASASSRRIPLGALNPLLSQLESHIAENPLLVVSALQHLLVSQVERPVILLVDNAEELDEMSASVLAQLARMRSVKLVVICTALNRAPLEICELWQDGCLTRIDVLPLTLDEVQKGLSTALNSRISAAAAHFLWASSKGHPQYIEAMTQELIERGQLVADEEGTWVMSGAHPAFGQRLAETVMGRLRGYDPRSRIVIELLALTGGLPLDCLLDNADQQSIDVLQEDGLIVFDRSEPAIARVADQRVAQAIRSAVPLGRKHAMLKYMLEHACPSTTENISWQMEYVGWRVECGMSVPEDRLFAAAREGNSRRDPENALWFLRKVATRWRNAAAVLEEAHAHVLLGDSAAAIRLLDGAVDPEASLPDWVHLQLLRGTLIQRHPQRHVETQGILRSVQERLAGAPGAPGVEGLRACFAAVDIENAAFEGRLQDMERAAAELALPINGPDLTWRLRGAAWQAEAAALMGRQEEGLAKLKIITERMVDARVDQSVSENAQAGVLNALIVAGRWREAVETVRQWRTQHGLPHHYNGIDNDLAEGVLHVLAGRGGAALERLEPVISQLTSPDSAFYRARVEAATAYAHALQGDIPAAKIHLIRAEIADGNPDWGEKQLFTYLYWMAVAAVEGHGRASRKLLDAADENAEKGAGAFELIHLTAAVMLGQSGQASRLAETARRQQGVFAEVADSYATALLQRSSKLLTGAAHAALDMDFAPLALSALETARDWAGPSAGREAVQRIDTVLTRAQTTLKAGIAVEVLTAGERRIADLAAKGMPSKEIASMLNLSIRTVDGYLNRTYSKLNLSGRTQLRSVLG